MPLTPLTRGPFPCSASRNRRDLLTPVYQNFTNIFAPNQLSGLIAWFKASEITGLSDGDPVNTWLDLSGNSNDATAGTAPTYKVNIINGLPVVRFVGASSQFLNLGTQLGKPANYTVFGVWSRASIASDQWLWGSLDGSSGDPEDSWGVCNLKTDNTLRYYFGNGSDFSTGTAGTSVTTNNIFLQTTSRYTSGQTEEEWWANGASLTVTPTQTLASTCTGTPDPFGIGCAGNGAGAYFTGDIAELIIYDSALSNTSRANVEGYLSTTYAL